MRSPAVKRLMKEAQELREPTEQFHAQPLEDNLFEWHFTIRGPDDSEFDGGLYHGRIVLPPEYPMKPPSIIILTPNGRFEINKKICLSISGHHPESWQPSWSIRTAMLAIIGFMPTHGAGALGSLDYTPEERKVLARRSKDFKCSECGCVNNVLKPVTEASEKTRQEIKELASQIDFKDEKEKNEALKATKEPSADEQSPTDNSDTAEPQQQNGTNQQPFQNPFPFGQFPFRMPFMPPFPAPQSQTGTASVQQNQTGSINLAQVPRFPLPFVSPFLPPPPQMMHTGNGQFPPGMFPPWPPSTIGTGTRPPFIPPNPGESVPNNSKDTKTVQSSASQGSETNIAPASSANDTSEIQEEIQENPQESQSAEQASSNEHPSLRSQTTGVRRRLTASLQPEERITGEASNTQRPATSTLERSQRSHGPSVSTSARPRQSESPLYWLFVSVIVIAILLLILRRLYVMKVLPVLF